MTGDRRAAGDDGAEPAVIGDDEDVQVLHRSGQRCPGVRRGRCVAFDLPVTDRGGRAAIDRCFLLLDEGVQLTRPVRYAGTEIDGWWYIDAVRVEDAADGLVVHDLYVDLLVPGDGSHGDVLDLDDLADAMTSGALAPEAAADVLRGVQSFVDRRLMSPERRESDPDRRFPPEPIPALQALPPLG